MIENPTLRQILYNSGDVFLPDNARNFLETYLIGSRDSTFYITYWSIMHTISGMIFAYIYLKYFNRQPSVIYFYVIMIIIHTIWEIWQIFIGMSRPTSLNGKNNIVDTFVDTIMFLIGASLVFYYF